VSSSELYAWLDHKTRIPRHSETLAKTKAEKKKNIKSSEAKEKAPHAQRTARCFGCLGF
jgi:hypothetical protein